MNIADIIAPFIECIFEGLKTTKNNCISIEHQIDSSLIQCWEWYAKGENVININTKFNEFFNVSDEYKDLKYGVANFLLLYSFNYVLKNRSISLNTIGIDFDTPFYYDRYKGDDLVKERKLIIVDIATVTILDLIKTKFNIPDKVVTELKPAIKDYVQSFANI